MHTARIVGKYVTYSIILSLLPGLCSAISFVEVTASANINHSGPTYGASWGDFNGDGWPDIWVGNHYSQSGPSLYINNRDGTFSDQANLIWPGPIQDTHGAVWGDVDRDGQQDLYEAVGGGGSSRLWMNETGRFTDRAVEWRAELPKSRARTPLWLDWNNDGYLDLLLTEAQGTTINPFALRNTGTAFVDATNEVGVELNNTFAAYLADLSGDGILDVAMLNGGSMFPSAVYDTSTTPFTPRPDLMYPGSGVSDAVFADFNGDLKTDFFAVRGVGPKQLVVRSETRIEFRMVVNKNENAVSFTSAQPIIIEVYPGNTLLGGIAVGAALIRPITIPTPELGYGSYRLSLSPNDPEVAGTADHLPGIDDGIFVSFDQHLALWTVSLSAPRLQDVRFVVTSTGPIQNPTSIGFNATQTDPWPYYYLRTATGFKESRSTSGLGKGMPCFSAVSGDFDNDMDVDIYLACTRGVENVSNILLENRGDGTFSIVPFAGGATGSLTGRSDSVTVADYDQDGFLDLFLTNGEGGEPFNNGPHQLYRNVGNGNKWIQIDLNGRYSNPTGIGAVVIVTAGGKSQLREQNGGMHQRSQNHQRLHVGLSDNSHIDQIDVHWPSGIKQTLTSISANQIITITEASDTACGDGIDNDGDGLIDYPDDPHCSSWSGDTESGPELIYLQGSGSHGLVVIEAEHADAIVNRSSHSWEPGTLPGSTGGGSLIASPNIGVVNDVDYSIHSPRLDYKVKFVKTGWHYVWVKGAGTTGNGTVHVGLNGIEETTSARITGFNATSWTWSNRTQDGTVAKFFVSNPGVHTVNVWMREDGFQLDSLMITINPALKGGSGLVESYRYKNSAPTLTALGEQTSYEQEAILFNIQAHDLNNDLLSYSAIGLPPGISIDTSSGKVGGIIETNAALESPYYVTVTANDGSGTSNASTMTTFTWSILPLSVTIPISTLTYQQGYGDHGMVVIEAERLNSSTDISTHGWRYSIIPGNRGEGAMKALPDTGISNDTNFASASPRMDYTINFVKTGVHYVWLRGMGIPDGASAHVGLDGVPFDSADRITGFDAAWKWSNVTLDGHIATIDVVAPGIHTLNVWMREDGFSLDTIFLTINPLYVPWPGLNESYRY